MRVLATVIFFMSLISSHAFAEAIKSRDGAHSFNLYLTHSEASALNHSTKFSSKSPIERVSCSEAYGCQIELRPQTVQSRAQIQEMLRLNSEFGLPNPNLIYTPDSDDEILIVATVRDPKAATELFEALPGGPDVRSIELGHERFQLRCRRLEVNARISHGCTATGIFPAKAAQPAILTLASWSASKSE